MNIPQDTNTDMYVPVTVKFSGEFTARGESSLEVHNAVRFNPIPENAYISTKPLEIPDTRIIYCVNCEQVVPLAEVDPLHLWHNLKPIRERQP